MSSISSTSFDHSDSTSVSLSYNNHSRQNSTGSSATSAFIDPEDIERAPTPSTPYKGLDGEMEDVASETNNEGRCWRVSNKVYDFVKRQLFTLFSVSGLAMLIYLKETEYHFNDNQWKQGMLDAWGIGACAYIAFEQIALNATKLTDQTLLLLQCYTITVFSWAYLGLAQRELNVQKGSEEYEREWATLFAFGGVVVTANGSHWLRAKLPTVIINFKKDQFAYHSIEDGQLGKMPWEPITRRAFGVQKVVTPIVLGLSLSLSSVAVPNDSEVGSVVKYSSLHVGAFVTGMGLGNAVECAITLALREKESEGLANGNKRMAFEAFKVLSALGFPGFFAVAHDNSIWRFASGLCGGITHAVARRHRLEGTPLRSEIQAKRYVKFSAPLPWRVVAQDPFLRIGAICVVAGSVWGIYEFKTQVKWTSSYSALSAVIGMITGFVSQIFIDRSFEMRGNSSAWINMLKVNTADNPYIPSLLYFIPNSDIGPLYSKCINDDTTLGHQISDIVGATFFGYLNGIAATQRDMTSARLYQYILTSARKWNYDVNKVGQGC